MSTPTTTPAQVDSAPVNVSTVEDLEAAPLAASSSAIGGVRVPVQNLGLKPNVLPPVVAYFTRNDLAKESAVELKRWAKMFMVPSHKKPSEILDHIFAERTFVPTYLRRGRSLRTAAVERGIVRRNNIDHGRPRTLLKSVKNYNPHKTAIVEKAREELGPQSPVPTEVASPPPELPTSPIQLPSPARPASPAQETPDSDGPSRIDKGKGVDRSGYEPEEEIESPFLRPSRVPLGQMSKDDLIRRTGVDLSLDEFADEEHPDGAELELEYPEEGQEAEEEDNEEDEDPARGRDSMMVYTYPPADPQDQSWLANMLHALEQDGFAVQAELTRLRDVANKLSSELLLAEAEMDEEVIECNAFVENIRHFAGDAVVKRILDTAAKIKVPEFQVDEYVDEEEYEEEYEEPGAEPTEEQQSLAHTEEAEALLSEIAGEISAAADRRPSDAVSYLDPSSPPPTSPLARAEVRAKRRRDESEDHDEHSPDCHKRRRSDDSPSHRSQPPSCAGSPEVPLDLQLPDSPRLPLPGLWDGTTDPEPSSPAAASVVKGSEHGGHDKPRSPDREADHDGSERGCSRSRSGSGSPRADGTGSNTGSRDGSASYVPSEGGSRSASRSPSRFGSRPASNTPSSPPAPPARTRCACPKCRLEKENSSDTCDSWTDLVSPEMGLPPGWPDKMAPQYDYLKALPMWKEAMAAVKERERREAEAEREERERTLAEIAEAQAAAAREAEQEAEAEEAGAKAKNKRKGKGRAPAKRKAPAQGKAKGRGRGKVRASPQAEEQESELPQIAGSSSAAQAEDDGDGAEKMDVDVEVEAAKVADEYEADSEMVDQNAADAKGPSKKGKGKATGKNKKNTTQNEAPAPSEPMQVDDDPLPSASTARARRAPPPQTPVRRSTRRRGAAADTPAMELPSRTLDGRTIRRGGDGGVPPLVYGPPRTPRLT